MPIWVCLLRGVSLGRQRKLPMAPLRDALSTEGLTANPFAAHVADRPHLIRVIFLEAAPQRECIERLAAVAQLRDTCKVMGDHVYVDYVRGYHTAHRTAPYFTGLLGVDGTERNWRTVLALAELLEQVPSSAAPRKT